MSRFLVILAALALFALPAWGSAPPAPDLSEAELATLAKGEVLIRPPARANGEVVGVMDIPGVTPDQVWAVILDFPSRVDTVRVLREIEVYAEPSDPKGLGVSFHMQVVGSKVSYHLRYEIDREAGYCTYRLDPEREHDIADANGSYRLIELPGGGVRVVYRSTTDPGRFVPGFIQKMLAQDALKSQLEQMAQRAVLR